MVIYSQQLAEIAIRQLVSLFIDPKYNNYIYRNSLEKESYNSTKNARGI